VLQAVIAVIANSGDILIRRKREWIIPPKPLKENVDYTKRDFIAKVSHWLIVPFIYSGSN